MCVHGCNACVRACSLSLKAVFKCLNAILLSAAAPLNVTVKSLTSTSYRVSWVIDETMDVVAWTVYYRPTGAGGGVDTGELSVNVSGSDSSVVFDDLQEDVEYVFEVASWAIVDGSAFLGDRVVAMAVSNGELLVWPCTTD